jgi:ubiquinone/menaquinone biosynthesis C-methylase UbiE
VLNRFFATNQDLCSRVEHYLPQAKMNIFKLYETVVAEYMNSRQNQIVVDIGGGKSCPFAKYREPNVKARIIAVDVSEEELKNNRDVDEKRVADVRQGLPFEYEEVDLIVSRSVLEHLESLDEFVADSNRVLKKGGYYIHLFPSKFAPFALINQILPKKLSRKLLYSILPESKGICGYPAYYNDCYYSAIKRLLERHRFEVVKMRLSYYQSQYFSFFIPLFLVSALYEALLQALEVKNLCAYILVVARKK